MMGVQLEHAFVGCNRQVHALDWGQGGLIAYTAHNAVVIAEINTQKILARLIGHTGRANAVKWVHSGDEWGGSQSKACLLVSGSADHNLILWRLWLEGSDLKWSIEHMLKGHEGPITGICVQHLEGGSQMIISSSADDTVQIWTNDGPRKIAEQWHTNGNASSEIENLHSQNSQNALQNSSWQCRQKINLPLQIQHALAVTAIPKHPDWLILALGGVDNNVRLFLSAPNQPFTQVCKLSGHTNWIRCLALICSTQDSGDKILLASASQDKYIRIWSIQEENDEKVRLDADGGLNFARYAPRPGFKAAGKPYTCNIEAMLVGHEDWVHTVAWQKNLERGSRATLLSASMDRTMAIWRPDKSTGLWMSEESVGDAGPSNLGYFGGCWSPQGNQIIAYGYTGALHLWKRQGSQNNFTATWEPQHSFGGHFGAVVDISWSSDSKTLFSVSTDQTARIQTQSPEGQWFEIARPQVHGHDFSCITTMKLSSSNKILYASGSEEKVIRILEAPEAYLDSLAFLRGESSFLKTNTQGERALGASVPALGLSNKAVYASDSISQEEGPDLAPRASPGIVRELPLEEFLQGSSLWPEIFKAYGHGNDLFCMASDPKGQFLASACKAQSKEFAAIWIWQIGTWAPIQQLEAHTLTVIQMCFSPDGSYLFSVSRDRSLAVWAQTSEIDKPFKLLGKVSKAHSRVIWTVSCSHCGNLFATGGRDNLLKIWSIGSQETGLPQKPLLTLPSYSSSVQAVSFAPYTKRIEPGKLSTYLAIGLEEGNLFILNIISENGKILQADTIWKASQFCRHSASVRRLSWKPDIIENREDDTLENKNSLVLASAGEDHAIQIFRIHLEN